MCFRHRPLILVAQISSLFFRFVFGHPSLEGDAGYTVEFGDFSHTSTFYLDPAAVLSGEQDNFELVVLGCEEYDEELPMFGLSNSGFVYSDLFTAGATSGDCPVGEVAVNLFGRMDSYSEEENAMALIDFDYVGDFLNFEAVPTEWFVGKGEFVNNQEINMEACLDPTRCYVFFLFDTHEDGLFDEDSDGLTVSVKSPHGTKIELFTMMPNTAPNLDTGSLRTWYELVLNCD